MGNFGRGGNLNIVNQWGEPQKGGGGTKFVKFSGGKQKGAGGTRFLT